MVRPITLPRPIKPTPLTDWRGAMRGEIRAAQSRARAKRLQFGFPQQPAPAPAAPEFGWDYARTHRLELLSDGGMLINLNDHCVLVVYLLLIPGCHIGKIPANGHLFDGMHDREEELLGELP